MRPAALTILLAALMAVPPAAAAAQGGQPPQPAEPAEPRTSLTEIEDEVMCPICGTPLSLAAAPQAERQRAFIRRLIAEGRTKEEIKQAMVDEFGPDVLATPQSSGFDLAAWIVPGGGLLLAAGALGVGVWRWRGRAVGSEAAPGPSSQPVDADDEERLRSDLARYDL